jgi:glycosyltransferase involved in cell wall biosynthesis
MFERDVDYGSGAFLLTPRETFLGSGGFDDAFRPAYYEDADYCLRLWDAGQRVVYDPRAVALHFEFASSASIADALAAQAERREMFRAKHAASLSGRPAPSSASLLAARARHAGRRILFVDDRVPHPALGSGYPRAGEILKSLLRQGHFVTLYPLRFPTEEWEGVYAAVPRTVEVMVGHGIERFAEFRRERRDYYDLVIVSRDHNLRQLRQLAVEGRIFGATPVVYDAEALSCLRDVARRRLAGERIDPPEVERLVRDEASLAAGASALTCVSEIEAARFRDAGLGPVVTVGHAVEIAPTDRAFHDREGLLFVGAVPEDASPNADALVWLLTEILPRLRERTGQPVSLTLAGVNASARVARLQGAGISHLGPVEDLRPLYDRARVFVAPTRFAAGLPLKVYHAAAHGLPVVCTSLLAAQLGWRDGVDLLVADDADAFARRCAELHGDPALWSRLREQSLARVARECGTNPFDAALRTALDHAMGTGKPRGVGPSAHSAKGAALPPRSADPLPAPPADRVDRPRTAARLPDDQADRIASLERALGDARRDIAALRASASWRITAPLRALHAWLVGANRRRG